MLEGRSGGSMTSVLSTTTPSSSCPQTSGLRPAHDSSILSLLQKTRENMTDFICSLPCPPNKQDKPAG